MSEKVEARLLKLLSSEGKPKPNKVRNALRDYVDACKRQSIKSANIAAKTQELEAQMAAEGLLVEELQKSNNALVKNEMNLSKLSQELNMQQRKAKLDGLRLEEDNEKQKALLSAEFQARLASVSKRVEAIQPERVQLAEEEEELKKEIGVLMNKSDAEERKEKKALVASGSAEAAPGASSSGEEYEERLFELRERGDMAYCDYCHRVSAALDDTTVYSALISRHAAVFNELQSLVKQKNDELRGQQETMKTFIDAINEEERGKKALEFVAAEKAVKFEQAKAAKSSSERALETLKLKRSQIQKLEALKL